MTSTLDYHEWNKLSRKYALTIKDILDLKPGERIKVLSMDRNVWDVALNNKIRGKSCKPQEFFNSNWAIYEHEEDLKGKYLLFSFECGNDINENDLDNAQLDGLCQPNFEFHLEYMNKSWYPLNEGYLPGSDPQGFSNFPWASDQDQHWSSFPETTKVGYRGHFVLWSKLEEMPNIIYPHSEGIKKAFADEKDITYDRHFKITTNDTAINSMCTKFDWNRESHRWAANGFMWHVREEHEKKKKNFPISFNVDISETTEKSNKMTYKYAITCEKDGEVINGMRPMGRNTVTKIKKDEI